MIPEDEKSINNESIFYYDRIYFYIIYGCVLLSGIGSLVALNRTKKKHRKPPGPIPQYINNLLHKEPFSFIFHGIFWSGVLILICPILGSAVVFMSFYRSIKFFISPKGQIVNAKNGDKELAVYITGCDSGFGKDLAFILAMRGFVVFPGCLLESSMKQYEGNDNIIPLKVDVTKENDSVDAATAVSSWLKEPSQTKKKTGSPLHRQQCWNWSLN